MLLFVHTLVFLLISAGYLVLFVVLGLNLSDIYFEIDVLLLFSTIIFFWKIEKGEGLDSELQEFTLGKKVPRFRDGDGVELTNFSGKKMFGKLKSLSAKKSKRSRRRSISMERITFDDELEQIKETMKERIEEK